MIRRVNWLVPALLICAAANGQTSPVVRANMSPETVGVGEAATLQVVVLVPTWFAEPPLYPSFELANAMTRLPPDSSYPVSERIGGETWSGIARSYRVYPLLGATYRLQGQVVKVTYANPGGKPFTEEVPVPPVTLRATVPTGAQSLDPYLAGRNLTLTVAVNGELGGLTAGDALVLEYVAKLDGMPSIFLPPLAPAIEAAGVSVYSSQPELEDGDLAWRREKVTLVFDAGGEFVVPDVTLGFWNTASGAIETATAAGFTVSVSGPPAAPNAGSVPDTISLGKLVATVAGGIAAVFVLFLVLQKARRARQRTAARRRQTEAFAFQQLSTALRGSSSASVYHAMRHWSARLAPVMSPRQFALNFGDETLCAAIDDLSASLYANAGIVSDSDALKTGLAKARARYLQQTAAKAHSVLPPLNPS